jgi:hypothetical protein
MAEQTEIVLLESEHDATLRLQHLLVYLFTCSYRQIGQF